VRDTGSAAPVIEHARRRAREPNAFIDLAQQYHAGVAGVVSSIERRLDHAAAHLPERYSPVSTVWHRQSRLFIDVKRQ
jgi:hypothetical protein